MEAISSHERRIPRIQVLNITASWRRRKRVAQARSPTRCRTRRGLLCHAWCFCTGIDLTTLLHIIARMASLTVVGFASGSPQSQAAMARIARDHRLAAIVVPPPRGGLRQKMRRLLGRTADPLAQLGAPLIAAAEVVRFRPDVMVVASFPRIIPAATLAVARIGALNLHMSLLPRHRGPDPIFWTYWDDDREAGVTIHWINQRIDAGDIVTQRSVPLERGRASRDLYMHLTSCGAELLAGTLAQIASGDPPRRRQDEMQATYESAADIAGARVPFAQWSAERVWHVLSGLGDQRSGLIADPSGRQLAHGRAVHYRITGEGEPGRITMIDAGYQVHCSDGTVTVERRPAGG
jgi:methionyl-tRNA formyltransferase